MEEQLKKAFTLAEVMITLGVIGIVAAMTLPALVQKNSEKETAAKLKKFNSTMNQAFMLSKNKNGDIENWGLTKAGETSTPTDEEIINGNNTRNKFWEIMSPYLKIVSRCKAGTNECTAYNRYSLDGTSFSTFTPYIILSDGIYIVGTTVLSSSCSEYRGTSRQLQNVCGEILSMLTDPNRLIAQVKMCFYFITQNTDLCQWEQTAIAPIHLRILAI